MSFHPPRTASSSSSTSSHPTPFPSASDDVFSAPLPAALDSTLTSHLQYSSPPDPRDPISQLARSTTPFFLDIKEEPQSPTRYILPSTPFLRQSPVTSLPEGLSGSTAWSSGAAAGGELGLGGGQHRVWASPGGVQGSMSATSKMDLATAAEVSRAFTSGKARKEADSANSGGWLLPRFRTLLST